MSVHQRLITILLQCLYEGRWVYRAGKPGCPRRDCRDLQVLYDTPQGTIRLTVQDYTPAAAVQGVQCQIGHRKVGDIERRSPPLSLGGSYTHGSHRRGSRW